MAEPKQFVVIDSIPYDYTENDRKVLGKEVVRFIQKRTRAGKNINNGNFTRYSTEYMESLDFKNAGKTSTVDLQLTGDMLGDLKLLNQGRGFITVGYDGRTAENDRAAYHRHTNAGPTPNVPKRDFLGISKNDLNSLIEQFPPTKVDTPERDIVDAEVETAKNVTPSVVENIFKLWGL